MENGMNELVFRDMLYEKLNMGSDGVLAFKAYRAQGYTMPDGYITELLRIKELTREESDFFGNELTDKKSSTYRKGIKILSMDNFKVTTSGVVGGGESITVTSRSEIQYVENERFRGNVFMHKIEIRVKARRIDSETVGRVADFILRK